MNQPLPPDSPWDELELDPREFERSMDTLGLPHDATGNARFGGRAYAPGGQVKSNPFEGMSDVDLAAMSPGQIAAWLARVQKFRQKGIPENILPGPHSRQDATRQAIESVMTSQGAKRGPLAPVVEGPWTGLTRPQQFSNARFRWPREDNQISPSVPGRPQAFSPPNIPSSEVVPFNPPRPNPFLQGHNEWFAKHFPGSYPGADVVNHPMTDRVLQRLQGDRNRLLQHIQGDTGPKVMVPPLSGAEVIKPKFGRPSEPRGPAEIIEYPRDPYRADGGSVMSDRMKLPGHTTDYATGDPLPLRGPAPARFPSVVRDWQDFFTGLGRDAKKLFSPQDYQVGGTVHDDIERSRFAHQMLDQEWDWVDRPPNPAGPHEGLSDLPENSVIGEKMRKRLGVDRQYVNQPERFDIKGSRQLSPELLSEQYWPTPSMRSHERPWKNKYFTDPMTDAIMSVQRNLGKGEDAYKARHFSTGVYNSFTNPVSLPGFIAGAPQFVQNAWQLKDEVPEYISRKAQGKPAHLDWEKVGETFGAAGATPWRQMVSPLSMSGFRPPMGAGRTYDSRPASPFQLQPMPNKPMEISPRQQYQITARKSHGEGMSTDSPIGNVSVSQTGPRRTPTLSIDELNVPTKQINDRMLKSLVGELEYQYPHAVRLNKFSKPLNQQGTANLQMGQRNLAPYEWGYQNPMTDVKKKLRDYFFYTRSDPSGMAGGRGNANGGRAYKDGGRVEYKPFWMQDA